VPLKPGEVDIATRPQPVAAKLRNLPGGTSEASVSMTGAEDMEEDEIAGKLAEMSRHTSLMALETVIRLATSADAADASVRAAAVGEHIAAGAGDLARSIELSRRAAIARNAPIEPLAL
jgi:hypothetical protein